MATKNVVFLIHGIGREGDDWAADPLAEVQAAADLSGAFETRSLADQVRFIPIVYNDIFDLVLERWNKLSTDLQNSGAALPGPVDTLNDFLAEISTHGNTVAEYCGDAILYVGFRLVRNAVLLRTINKVVEGITNAYDAYVPGQDAKPKFGIIAHSLGTTVAHDAMHLLATLEWGSAPEVADMRSDVELLRRAGPEGDVLANRLLGAFNPATPAAFNFDSIFMISNTSRLLHSTERDPYHSCIYPSGIDFPPTPGYCDRFFEVDNKYDFVSLSVKAVGCAFSIGNDNWTNHGIGNSTAAKQLSLEHLHQPNAHDLAHYLKHPKVYSEVFRRFASTYEDQHYQEALSHPFENFPNGQLQAQVSVQWDQLLQALAHKLVRGGQT